MTAAAREQGIKAVAYMNVLGNVYLASKHPDWYVRNKDGTYPHGAWLPQEHSWIDVSSPFLEQVFKPLLKEVITKYSPDAIWLDGGSWMVESHSYSPYTRDWYRRVTGEDVPDSPAAGAGPEAWSKWARWRAWRRSVIADYLRSVTAFVHQIDPRILVTDNGVGRYDRGIPVMKGGAIEGWSTPRQVGLDFLSSDPVPFGGNHAVILSRVGRYQATLGMPFDFANERFQGWGEWDLRETADFNQESATILSIGGRCFISDQPWPDGALEPEVYKRIKENYAFVQAREEAYRGAELISDIGIFAAESTNTMAGDLRPLEPATSRSGAVDGATLALTQEGVHFTIFSEANLADALRQVKVLIVPEQALMLDSSIAALRAFAEAGGRLFITGQSGRFDWNGAARSDDKVERLLGVRLKGTRRAPLHYYQLPQEVRAPRNLPAIPMMVRGPMYDFDAPGAKTFALVLEPRDDPWDENGAWRHYTVTGAMPPKRTTSGVGAALFLVGKGRVLYAAGNWFATYQRLGNPSVRKMLATFLAELFPEQERMLVVRQPLRVETTMMRNSKGYLVTLVNSAMQKQSGLFVSVEELAPAANLTVSFKAPEPVRRVVLLPEGSVLPFKASAGRVNFAVPRLDIHAAVQIETR